jgi:predicted transcriptional regulator
VISVCNTSPISNLIQIGAFPYAQDRLRLRSGQAPQIQESADLTLCLERITPPGMKTVSIAIDERLLKQIDAVAQARRRKRSELFCEAARQWLKQQRLKALVKQDREGYRQQPVQPDEFGPLIQAQRWGRL